MNPSQAIADSSFAVRSLVHGRLIGHMGFLKRTGGNWFQGTQIMIIIHILW